MPQPQCVQRNRQETIPCGRSVSRRQDSYVSRRQDLLRGRKERILQVDVLGLDGGQSLYSSLDTGSHLSSIIKKKKSQLCTFFPSSPPSTIEVFSVGQLVSTFLSKRFYSFGISETICFLKNTCHWIHFKLTCD